MIGPPKTGICVN